jgi:hypothetical protein
MKQATDIRFAVFPGMCDRSVFPEEGGASDRKVFHACHRGRTSGKAAFILFTDSYSWCYSVPLTINPIQKEEMS